MGDFDANVRLGLTPGLSTCWRDVLPARRGSRARPRAVRCG